MDKKGPPPGSVFLVPLRSNGYCVGVLASSSGKGHAFGYFFGPKISKASDVDINALAAKDAIIVGKFGDLELIRGNWPTIGEIKPWDRSRWPMLPLARIDESTSRAWLSTYDDNFECIEERKIAAKEVDRYPYDRMMGTGSVEIRLTSLSEEDN